MINFETDKGPLTLASDTKVGLTYNNPLLEQNFQANSYSFGVDVPITTDNVDKLGQGYILESNQRPKNIDIRLLFKNTPLSKGQFSLIGFSNKAYRYNMVIDTDNINFGSKQVGEIVNEVISFADVDTMLSQFSTDVNKKFPVVNYCLPMVHNKDFYNGANDDFAEGNGWEFINKTNGDNPPQFIKNEYHPSTTNPNNVNTLVPFFYVKYIIQKIVENSGYTIAGDWWNDEVYNAQFLYNNFPLDKLTSSQYNLGSYLSVYNSSNQVMAYSTTKGQYWISEYVKMNHVTTDSLSLYDNTEFTMTIDRVGDYVFSYNINFVFQVASIGAGTGKCRCRIYFEKEINGDVAEMGGSRSEYTTNSNTGTSHNLTKSFSFSVNEENVGAIIKLRVEFENEDEAACKADGSLGYISASSTWTGTLNNIPYNLNTFTNTINVGNHMPSITCQDFINEYCKQYGIYYTLDKATNIIYFNYLSNFAASAKETDWTDKVAKGYDCTIEKIKTRGWKFDFIGDTLPERVGYLTKAWFNYNYDAAETKITFKFCPVLQQKLTYFDEHDTITTPCIEGEQGASPLFGIGGTKNTASLKVMFYWGMVQIPAVHLDLNYYNYASGDISHRPDPIGYVTTTLKNSDGTDTNQHILGRHHNAWNNFVDSLEPFVFDVALTIAELSQIQSIMKTKIRIKNSQFVLKDVQINVGQSIELATCKLMKINA